MKNNVYPCKPQFYYIKVGFKGVKIIQACFHDAVGSEYVLKLYKNKAKPSSSVQYIITKTRLFKYTENFTNKKMKIFR